MYSTFFWFGETQSIEVKFLELSKQIQKLHFMKKRFISTSNVRLQ